MTKLNNAVMLLDMSLVAAKAVLAESNEPLQRRLAWLGQELERLAGEAYRLADEAGDDTGPAPERGDYCVCLAVPCTCGARLGSITQPLAQVLLGLPIQRSPDPVR